jgi:S-adenosylmethionine-dependent methyltransferase
MEIRFLNERLAELHRRVCEISDLIGHGVSPNVAGYELAYAQGRDPFPPQEAEVYLDVLKPYLLRVAPPPASVLDIGGGTGRMALPLAEAGYVVTILDPAASGLGIAHAKALRAGVGARLALVCGEASDIAELGPGSFDAVLGLQSLLYLDDLPSIVSAMVDVARHVVCFDVPSLYGFLFGRLLGFGVTPGNIEWVLDHHVTPGEETLARERFRCYTSGEVERIAVGAGLRIDRLVALSFLEVLGWRGDPADLAAKAVEDRLRNDEALREMAAFHLVMGHKPSTGR